MRGNAIDIQYFIRCKGKKLDFFTESYSNTPKVLDAVCQCATTISQYNESNIL